MKTLFAVLLGYVALVALVEIATGFLQPEMDSGVDLTTRNAAGETRTRKLAGFAFEGALYVSSNHWLRGWYREALAHPEVELTQGGVVSRRIAVPIGGDERARVAAAYDMGFVLRFLCGFAPSRFLRLDPVAETG